MGLGELEQTIGFVYLSTSMQAPGGMAGKRPTQWVAGVSQHSHRIGTALTK